MRAVCFATILSILLLSCGCGRYGIPQSAGGQDEGANIKLDDVIGELEGVWLNSLYVRNIQQKIYFRSDNITLYRITFSSAGKSFGWSGDYYNGSEGGNIKGLAETATPNLYSLLNEDGTNSDIKIEVKDGFVTGIRHDSETFTRIIGSEDYLINRSFLQGYYEDSVGKLYSFNGQCKANWPNFEFDYSFCDTLKANCNMITTVDESGSALKERYGIDIEGEKIYLYRINAVGDYFEKSGPPITVLKPFDPSKTKLLEDYTVGYIRFYESGTGESDADERVYLDSFPASSTRCVNWEIGLNYEAGTDRRDFRVYEAFYSEDGTLYGEGFTTENFYAESGWESSSYSWGYGSETPGTWDIGKYRVEVWINSQKAVEGTFEIFDDSRPVPSQTENDSSGLVLPESPGNQPNGDL